MTNLTIEMVEAMNYKELQATAKDMGIRANQKMDVLVTSICAALVVDKVKHEAPITEDVQQSAAPDTDDFFDEEDDDDDFFAEEDEPTTQEPVITKPTQEELGKSVPSMYKETLYLSFDEMDELMNMEVDKFSPIAQIQEQLADVYDKALQQRATAWAGNVVTGASETSASNPEPTTKEEQPASTSTPVSEPKASDKLIEYVNGTDVAVHYRVKGEDVIVGWSRDDYKLHIWSRRKGDRIVSYATLVNMMSKFTKGVHGDVGLVVKAFSRIRKKPAKIVMLERNNYTPKTTPVPNVNKQDQQERPNRGMVDPQWLAAFREKYEANRGQQPSGQIIRAAWAKQQAKLNAAV